MVPTSASVHEYFTFTSAFPFYGRGFGTLFFTLTLCIDFIGLFTGQNYTDKSDSDSGGVCVGKVYYRRSFFLTV